MTKQTQTNRSTRRLMAALTAVASFGLIVSAAGAADRVVLGEYFTNLF